MAYDKFELDNNSFDLSSGWGDKNERSERDIKIQQARKIAYEKLILESAENFKNIIDLPLEKKHQYRIITTCNFNALTVLNALLENYNITEATIAIYRMNIGAVETIKEMAEIKRIPTYILLSSFFRENKKYERWTQLIEEYAQKSKTLHVSFTWNHAKVCLLKTGCGKHIVFEGSGNLSDNARIEQYLIEDNEDSYEFHKNWIMEFFK